MPIIYDNDTITAIATAHGEAGISVIRISGPNAISISNNIFAVNTPNIEPNIFYIKWIIDPITRKKIDQTSFVFMKAPRSYTGEDVVEIGCHGSIAVTNRILEIILTLGARLADRGEFTKRAFLNGKMDLIQAESVIDLIKSKTNKALDASVRRLNGGLSESIKEIRGSLIQLIAAMEASIDFSDDVNPVDNCDVYKHINSNIDYLDRILGSADLGISLNKGVRVAIVGKPNVGKSSLFNALVGRDRAIVTDIEGTTTDTIEEFIAIDGIPFIMIDTAGLRDSSNAIEEEGIRRTKEAIESSDIVLVVVDGSKGINIWDKEIIEKSVGQCNKVILAINKCDLKSDAEMPDIAKITQSVKISAVRGYGIADLETMLKRASGTDELIINDCLLSNFRQKESAMLARDALIKANESLDNNMAHDFVVIDLKSAAAYLGEMTGESVSSEIIDKIFSDFCIGK